MDDDIVTRLRERCAGGGETRRLLSMAVDEIEGLRAEVNSMASAQAGWGQVERLNNEIERLTEWRRNALLALDKREAEIGRLRALCSDLYHDATCSESFCRLCGEGIREWEAMR